MSARTTRILDIAIFVGTFCPQRHTKTHRHTHTRHNTFLRRWRNEEGTNLKQLSCMSTSWPTLCPGTDV